MADQKKKSQAERAVSAASHKSSGNNKTGKQTASDKHTKKDTAALSKNKNTTSSAHSTRDIPVRFYTSCAFIGCFLLFIIMAIVQNNGIFDFIETVLYGLFGKVCFYLSIPVLLYLFYLHAFSGKKSVKGRTICTVVFLILCTWIGQFFVAGSADDNFIVWLYDGGIDGRTGGVLVGSIALLFTRIFGTVIPPIACIVAAIITLLGAFGITIPGIIQAVRERPRADWEEDDEDDKPNPSAVVVNHIANKRIEHIENKRAKALALAEERAAEEMAAAESKPKTQEEKATDIMRQISADVEDPVAAASQAGIQELAVEEEVSVPSFVKSKSKPVPASTNISKPEPIPSGMPVLKKDEPTGMPEFQFDVPTDDTPVFEEDAPIEKPYVKPENTTATAVTTSAVPLVVRPRKVSAKDADESAQQIAAEIAAAEETVKPQYCYPPIDLLKMPDGGASDGTAEMRENTRRLSETLASFKIEAKIINVTRGPSVTRYEVELEKGVRLNKLTTTADDIALSLGATSVRIAAIPGKISIVGIEVPNRVSTSVSLREVIDSQEFKKAKSKSAFAVGKDIGGNCIVGNIAKLPHVLVAGTTGAGKSVCINSMIISLMYKATPDDVKFIMVDPKMVEMRVYEGIPQLLIPVVTDPKKAAGSLQWAVSEMMRRYKAMSDAGVRDLESYNSIMEHEENTKKLPQVVIFIDELADLMLVAAKEVEESICRIAQMGRAAGMHLVLATQRPSADVITGLMKANIPSRIALTVASAMESRIILDTQGAEKLCGRGDMLFAPIGDGKPKRVQGCYVSDGEVEAVANYVKNNFTADYDQEVMEEIEKKAAQTGSKNAAAAMPAPTEEEVDGDEMLPAAVDVILETGQASVSMLQRRLKLGYARAARIVDEMEEKGIVGPFQGSKPRTILVTKEQWEAMRSGGNEQMQIDELQDEKTDYFNDEF